MRTLTIHRASAYEIQAFWTRPGRERALEEWLAVSSRQVREHGGDELAAFTPLKALYGDYLPTIVRLLVWSDTDAPARLRRDPGPASLDPLLAETVADATRTRLRLHPQIHAEPDEIELTFDDGLCYEISAFWDRPEVERARWEAFIEAVTPSIDAHGGHPLLVFEPTACERGDFFPNRICLAAWDTLEHFESFVAAPEHAEISRLRWLAVSRMDATATRLADIPVAPAVRGEASSGQ